VFSVTHFDEIPDNFLPDSPEGNEYYRAFEKSSIEQFKLGYLEIKRDGLVVSRTSYFVMKFYLNTMIDSVFLKKLIGGAYLRVAFVGHPSSDFGYIQGDSSADALAILNKELFKLSSLICYKGFDEGLDLSGFTKVPGEPVPVLNVDENYWRNLKHKIRTDLKRKLKAAEGLRLQETDGLPDAYVSRIFELYKAVYAAADHKFELLNVEYFRQTSSISKYLLYFEGDQLIGFAQLLSGNGKLFVKYVGMDYTKSKQYKLYYALLIQSVNVAIRDKFKTIDFGITTYTFKKYLGSKLYCTYNFYAHKNSFVHWILCRFAFLFKPSASALR